MTHAMRTGRKSSAKKMLLSSILLLSLGAGSSQAQSLSEFTHIGSFDGHDYYLTPKQDIWSECEKMATNVGGHLTSINSFDENNFITSKVSAPAWIGLHKNAEGTWSWSDEAPLNTNSAFWGKIGDAVQPDNFEKGQNAALINSGGVVPPSHWDDGNGDTVKIFGIVELPSCTSEASMTASASEITLGYGVQSVTLTEQTDLPDAIKFQWTVKKGNVDFTSLLTPGTNSAVFSPLAAGPYTVEVTVSNASGCTASASATILVTEIREFDESGKPTGKILICHNEKNNPMNKYVPESALKGHLGHGDYLGACVNKGREVKASAEVKVYPNPTQSAFVVEVPQTEGVATVTLMDLQGKVLETRQLNANENREVRFDLADSPLGLYVVEVSYDGQRFHSKLVRQ